MKKRTFLISFTILAAVIGIGLALDLPYLKGLDLVPVLSWSTYEGDEWGFKIKYPRDWNVQTRSSGDVGAVDFCHIAPEANGGAGCPVPSKWVQVSQVSLTILPPRNGWPELGTATNTAPETFKMLMVDGEVGIMWGWKGWGCLFAEWQGPSYEPRLYSLSACDLPSYPQNENIFEQMVSSFRFSK